MRGDLADRFAGHVLAFEAIARGDIPGISCVVIDGHVWTVRSRNSPLAKRLATFKGISVPGAGH